MSKQLVVCGGGVKGFSFIGALRVFERRGIDFASYIGSSIGGLFVTLVVMGYTSKQLEHLSLGLDLTKFLDMDVNNILPNLGLDSGESMRHLYLTLFKAMGYDETTTFQQLFEKTERELILTGTCYDTVSTEYFSHNTHPDMPVLTAIQITTRYPVVFTPILYDSKHYADGGIMNNYPIDYPTDLEKIGLVCLEDLNYGLTDLESLIGKLIVCIIDKDTRNKIARNIDNTIVIDTPIMFACSFDISNELINNMIQQGEISTNKFFEDDNDKDPDNGSS